MFKKWTLPLLIGVALVGCSEETKNIKSKSSETPEAIEVTKEEKNEYVNRLLDVNEIWISVLEEIEIFTKTYSPYEVKEGKPAMRELKTILSRIDSEMVPAFNNLGFPPSEDLEALYKIESDYVHEAQEIADQLPMVMSGDPDIKAQFKERLSNMKSMSGQMSEIISSLQLN